VLIFSISLYQKSIRFLAVLIFFIFLSGSFCDAAERLGYILTINGAIGPATVDYIGQGLKKSRNEKADFLILKIDTPGGLDKSMRAIIKDILSSPIPVITYVAPSGARAASAGTYILYASHVAAMAPGTNLGAATPVSIGGIPKPDNSQNKKEEASSNKMEKKVISDSAAYIRSLANLHGRNAQWAEQAVVEAKSLSAEEAFKMKVIDLVAENISDLLKKVDGRKVTVNGEIKILRVEKSQTVEFFPDWKNRFLSVITSPDVAYILLLIGVYGLFFEFYSPGFVLPGIVGGISLLLALYAFHMLPINYVGLVLLLFGLALFVVEMVTPSFGILGMSGIVSFILGSFMLLDPASLPMEGGISRHLIFLFSAINAVFFTLIFFFIVKARRSRVMTGQEELMGSIGVAVQDFEKEGMVRVHGELWKARSEKSIKKDQHVKVIGVENLTLLIELKNQL